MVLSKKHAYVMVIWGGDRYLAGVLAVAYSLIRLKTKKDIVCLVTNDVPNSARNTMKKLNIIVKEIPYLCYNTYPLKTKKQRQKYPTIQSFYTKYNILNLIEYDKVIYLDSDLIVVNSLDHLFRCKPPLALFENQYDSNYTNNNRGIKNYYTKTKLKYLEKIKNSNIKTALYNSGFVANGTILLIKPDKTQYINYKKMMNKLSINKGFGSSFNTYSGPDEISIIYFMTLYSNGPKLQFRNLPIKYSYLAWKYTSTNQNRDSSDIKILDFFGTDKTWEVKRDEYEDVEIFYGLIRELLNKDYGININELNMKYKEDILKNNDYNNKYYKYFKKKIEDYDI